MHFIHFVWLYRDGLLDKLIYNMRFVWRRQKITLWIYCLISSPLRMQLLLFHILLMYFREVIEKKPEEFKIAALRDILGLFPSTKKPFHSGFGNKINVCYSLCFPYVCAYVYDCLRYLCVLRKKRH